MSSNRLDPPSPTSTTPRRLDHRLLQSTALVALCSIAPAAHATVIQTNLPDLSIRWDNTATESILGRTETPSKLTKNSPNSDDTDRDFRGTLAAARTDLYSELDVKYKRFGIRASAAAWYDPVYDVRNTNNSPSTLNSILANNRDWQRSSAQLAGYHAEIADMFTYGSVSFGHDQTFSYRVGQFAQLWGESLYLASNGIAGGMNPIDAIKGQLLLNPQARDVYMATPQISITYQPIAPLSISAYYKLGYRQTRVSPVGTYFSASDILDVGGDKLFPGGSLPGIGRLYFRRGNDIKPHGLDGQFGVAVRYNFGGGTLGLYGLRYDEVSPQQIYLHPDASQISTGRIGSYQIVYPKGIQLYGASYSTNIFDVINLGAELSARHGVDLVSAGEVAGPDSSNGNNVLYPVGDTLHGQLSVIYASPPVRLIHADQISITGEVGFNQLLDAYQNSQALAEGVSHFASLINVVAQASYYSIRPGLDLTPSVGIQWQLCNNSAVDVSERAHTGNLSLGLTAVLDQKYNFLMQYRHYIGDNSNTNPTDNNALLGRDFVGVSVSTTL